MGVLTPGDVKILKKLFDDAGEASVSALAGGTFVPKPVTTWDMKLGLLWGLISGYFDVYADVQGGCACVC